MNDGRGISALWRRGFQPRQQSESRNTPNRRIILNIIVTYGRSLYALVCGVFISRWVLAAAGKSECGLYGVVGGMTVLALLVYVMRRGCGGIAAVGSENYCSNLLW